MLDFNNKKETLRRLRARREKNRLMWLPCMAAELFVKLWYGLRCRLGLALSDKDGNFLGVKSQGQGDRPDRCGERNAAKKARRQDDIVYVKRPFFGRLMSAVLAAAFVLMFVPEMDFGIDVSAEIVDGYTVNGTLYVYDTNSSSDNYYVKSEYTAAEQRTIGDISYTVGYGSVKVNWTIGDLDRSAIDYFYVELVDTTTGANAAEPVKPSKDASEKIFTNVSTTANVKVRITPVTLIDVYKYIPPNTTDDDPNNDVAQMPLSQKKGYAVNGLSKEVDIGRLDASFGIPAITISEEKEDGTSSTVTDTTMEKLTGNKIKITWTDVSATGNANTSPTPHYHIYAYNVTDNTYVTGLNEIDAENTGGTVTYTVEGGKLQHGKHYQFFVEAYSDVWTNGEGGRISSSKQYTDSEPSAKFTGIYSKKGTYYKDLYIAPDEPNVTVSAGKNSIDLKWSPQNGSFDGVLIYRANDWIDKDSVNDESVNNGDITLSEWITQHVGIGKSTFDIEKVSDGIFAYPGTSTASDTDINTETTYYYYVIPYITTTGNNKLYGSFTVRPGSLSVGLGTGDMHYDNSKDGEITVSWDAADGADGYLLKYQRLKKYDPETGDIVPVDEKAKEKVITKGTSWTHTGLYNDEQYKYWVTPFIYVKDQNGTIPTYGTPYDAITVTVGNGLEAPENLTADGSKDGQVTLKWDKVDGATGYVIHYYNKSTEEVKEIKTSKTTYTQTNLNNDWVCEYYVTAYKTVNLNGADGPQTILSNKSGTVSVKVGSPLTVPQDLKLTTADGTVNVTWTAVSGAEGYYLYYKGSNGKEGHFDVAKPGFNHTGLNNNDTYSYYVIAYKTVNGETVESEPSVTVSTVVGVPLNAPKDFTGTTSDGRVDLTWSAVSGAEGYILHIISSNGTTQEIDLSKPGFSHTGLKNGDSYTYYVTAYKTVNGKRIYSDDSTTEGRLLLNFTVGDNLEAPKDFTAVTSDGQTALSWTAVKGATGYVLYAYGNGRTYQFDLSKNSYTHTGLQNGDSWTYYVAAYKTVNGSRVYSSPTKSITVTIGVSLNAAIDLVATAGNRQVDLSWSSVKGAEGYVVYLYNSQTMEFEPITVVSGTKYSHTGLTNGKKYTYMVAPFKTINGTRYYGEYSLSVDAVPSTGSATDIDRTLNVKGTTPYGISHSEYISAAANHGAFDESADVYFTTNKESTEAVKDVLKEYADGLSSFIIYPFDISVYSEGTLIEIEPNDGYSVTITMPIPDRLIAYRDYITVVHIGEYEELEDTSIFSTNDDTSDWLPATDRRLEVLPCAVVDIDNVWCVQFVCSKFSPFAFVIYKEHILDVSASGGVLNGDFAGDFNSGVLLFTALPDILPNTRRLKVVKSRKVYRIKNITRK